MGPEYLRCFPALDFVAVGEADESFPRLVAELSRGRLAPVVPGICRRQEGGVVAPPERAADEVLRLAGTHRRLTIDAVDNILDMRYLSTFCKEIATHGYDLTLFFEVKANLSPDQLSLLRSAGVTAIQPGIESLSSHVLRLMDKGTDLLLNVRLLKWALRHGIGVGWNILTGFPGETEADYLDQARLIPALLHLQPPLHTGDLRLERFSPYFTRPPSEFRNIRPAPVYSLLYPDGELDLAKIAYFFDYDADAQVGDSVRTALREAVAGWGERWYGSREIPQLYYERGPGWICLVDTRGTGPRERYLDAWRAESRGEATDR
jgi:ribosomal peptide maturation radical SAM protein 1